jgi:hypothetical protein
VWAAVGEISSFDHRVADQEHRADVPRVQLMCQVRLRELANPIVGATRVFGRLDMCLGLGAPNLAMAGSVGCSIHGNHDWSGID